MSPSTAMRTDVPPAMPPPDAPAADPTAGSRAGPPGPPGPAVIDLSVVIVNWNAGPLLPACVRSVRANLGSLRAEVLVVDNASSDDSAVETARAFPDVKIIANATNRGFAAANNQALARARGRFVLLLNPDTVVLDDVLPRAVAWLERHSDVGLLGCQVLEARGAGGDVVQPTCFRFPSLLNTLLFATGLRSLRPRGRLTGRETYGPWRRETVRDVDVVSGMFMLVRRAALEDVGPLDERYFVYAEETDWCRRLADAGWRRVFAPEVGRIHHVHGGGQCTAHVRTKMYVQLQKSLCRYHRKHHGRVAAGAIRALLFAAMVGRAAVWGPWSCLGGGNAIRVRARGAWAAARFHLTGRMPVEDRA